MKNEYEVTLPDNTKVHIYFYGKILEKIFDTYKVPYKVLRKGKKR